MYSIMRSISGEHIIWTNSCFSFSIYFHSPQQQQKAAVSRACFQQLGARKFVIGIFKMTLSFGSANLHPFSTPCVFVITCNQKETCSCSCSAAADIFVVHRCYWFRLRGCWAWCLLRQPTNYSNRVTGSTFRRMSHSLSAVSRPESWKTLQLNL